MVSNVCTLDEASLKKAREELNEDPADRMNAVEAFRNLIKTRAPHIRCSMGKCMSVCVCVRDRVCVCVCVNLRFEACGPSHKFSFPRKYHLREKHFYRPIF